MPALLEELIFQGGRVNVGVSFLPMHLCEARLAINVDAQFEAEWVRHDAALGRAVPFRHRPDRSVRERWSKWVWRHAIQKAPRAT